MPKPTVLSLFSGAGGIDYGLEASGFRTAVAVEIDQHCCETLRINRSWRVIEKSLFETSTEEILRWGELKRAQVDLVAGGPPCQPFSKASLWVTGTTRRLADPRASALGAFMRVVEEALPRAFILENVQGMTFAKMDEGLRILFDRVKEINQRAGTNYRPHCAIVNAADFGAPQVRERFFMIAARSGADFKFPIPTHGDPNDAAVKDGALEPYRTAWDALACVHVSREELEELQPKGKWADLLASIPEGQNYLWHTNRGRGLPLFGWRRRYWTFLLKLAKNRPSWTIQAQPGPAVGPFHWKNRKLSINELCKLQTFPENIRILGGRAVAMRQVGNAVPSLLAEVLGRAIRRQLLGQHPHGQPLLLPKRRLPIPDPERVREVSKKYQHLIGDHPDHPGPGEGPGAKKREQEIRPTKSAA